MSNGFVVLSYLPDLLFLADCRSGDRKVLFHIEFQATSDPDMPLRNLVYASLAAQKLRRRFRDLGESPALVVVSMVRYHGARPWNAPATAEELVTRPQWQLNLTYCHVYYTLKPVERADHRLSSSSVRCRLGPTAQSTGPSR